MERQHIIHMLKATHGNKSEAARRLGIERKTLYKKAVRSGHQSAVSGRAMTTPRLRRRQWWRTLSLASTLFLVVIAVSAIPVVRDFQLRIADTYFRTAPPPLQPSSVVLVLIDDESLREYGRWPWSRARVAELVRNLDRAGAQVIGLDILFSEPQSAGHRSRVGRCACAKTGALSSWTKLGCILMDRAGSSRCRCWLMLLLGVGHAQAVLDSDGLCRHFPAPRVDD